TSAMADLHVPIRAGTDVAFLGGLVNYVLSNELDFREYVIPYTNAASIVSDEFQDTEDLDGLFSGFDPETGRSDQVSWQYEGTIKKAAAGQRDPEQPGTPSEVLEGAREHESGMAEKAGSGGPTIGAKPDRDETLQDPRCVYQILKRHFARYTPEVVEEICGISPEDFERVAGVLTRNIGRTGGGIMALRGHTSIQGSTDIPTLFNILPGYIPMRHAEKHETLDEFVAADAGAAGFWGEMKSYVVSLLKSYWGDAATAEN